MPPRELILAAGTALLLGAAGLLVFGGGPAQPDEGTGPGAPGQGASLTEVASDAAAEATTPAPVEAVADAGLHRPQIDTANWTSGVIVGDVQIAVSALDRIQSIGVVVEECRNPIQLQGKIVAPWKRFEPVKLAIGTPTFEVRDVPFSPHGYVVRVHSPGLNGSQQTVAVTADRPYHEVLLSITRGAPYSVLLRDQDQAPVAGTDVVLMPNGDPPGRPTYSGRSDNFGVTVLEEVLAGDYRIFVGHVQRPLCEPVDVAVFPAIRVVRGKVQGQGTTIAVPRGTPLVVAVVDVAGYGVEGANVKVLATDRTRLSVLEAQSDWSGRATFPFLSPGSYQVDVWKRDFERGSRSIHVKEGEAPPELTFRLPRLR